MGKPVWIRHVLVPERNDKDEYLFRLADFIRSLRNVERVEVLPYTHSVCTSGRLSVMTILSRALIPRQKSVLRMRK